MLSLKNVQILVFGDPLLNRGTVYFLTFTFKTDGYESLCTWVWVIRSAAWISKYFSRASYVCTKRSSELSSVASGSNLTWEAPSGSWPFALWEVTVSLPFPGHCYTYFFTFQEEMMAFSRSEVGGAQLYPLHAVCSFITGAQTQCKEGKKHSCSYWSSNLWAWEEYPHRPLSSSFVSFISLTQYLWTQWA